MKTVAVVGANGFIGSRLVEILARDTAIKVRSVVRNSAHIARFSAAGLDCRLADACDETALAAAFAGCEVVVHAVAGGPEVILAAVAPAYRAAERAGVHRLVYLSSGSVHGQAPAPGTDEESPLSDAQPIEYNNAKVRAERRLVEMRDGGSVEIVILRPGVVLGPRSFWVTSFADALLAGEAYIVGSGTGICNSLYVDNLVHAIGLALVAGGGDGHAFLLGDREQATWLDLYRPIAQALGRNLDDVPRVPPADIVRQRSDLEVLSSSEDFTVRRIRRAVHSRVNALRKRVANRMPWLAAARPRPRATLEMSLLHGCRYKLPYGKAQRLLGYEPLITFSDGCRRTIEWMREAGYPITPGQDRADTRKGSGT